MVFDHLGWFPKLCVCCMFSYKIYAIFMLSNWSSCFSKLYCKHYQERHLAFSERLGLVPQTILQLPLHPGFFPGTSPFSHFHSPSHVHSVSLHPDILTRLKPMMVPGQGVKDDYPFPRTPSVRFGKLMNEANSVSHQYAFQKLSPQSQTY